MTVLFAASEEESFISLGNVDFLTGETARYDATMVNGPLGINNGASLQADFSSSSSDFFVHSSSYFRTTGFAVATPIEIRSGGTGIVRLVMSGANPNEINFEYNNGSGWVSIATDIVVPNILQPIDIHCDMAASGSFTLYQDDSQIAQFTGDTTQAAASADNALLGPTGFGHYVSQVIIADESTLTWQMETILATADGAATAWTGDKDDINEVGLYNDGTQINSSVADQEELFIFEDPTTPANYIVAALVLGTRSSRGSTGPQNMQFLTRSGGTNYPSSNLSGLGLGLAPFQLILPTDPDTALAWDDTSLAAAQFGVKSIT